MAAITAKSESKAQYNTHFFMRVVRECASLGISAQQVLHATGVNEDTLYDIRTRVPIRQTLALARNALKLSGNPAFGLQVGMSGDSNDGGIAAMAIDSQADLRRKAEMSVRYHKLYGHILVPTWKQKGDQDVYQPIAPEPLGELLPFFIEEAFASFLAAIRMTNNNQRVSPDVVRFSYSEPSCSDQYQAYFGCPIEFNAPQNEMAVSHAWLTSSTRRANSLNLHLYQQICDQMAAQTSLADQVRSLLQQQAIPPSLEDVAKQLGMASRTLTRHLASQGETYQALKDHVRIIKAQHLLQLSTMSIQEIGEAMGFQSERRFRDFFQRHVRETPSGYRRSRAAPR